MNLREFLKLPARERGLVAIAVLLDGIDATIYLDSAADNQASLKEYAAHLIGLNSELRTALLGSILRSALEDLKLVAN
ncbi:MAG TPA: hypothetical protein PKD37_01495 [Oligoflexia bacterium]|nr:hypothetical protein [Oligoflexia bacterium]HMP26650.1 hypothetical protein [Oligoflexia bacterium]